MKATADAVRQAVADRVFRQRVEHFARRVPLNATRRAVRVWRWEQICALACARTVERLAEHFRAALSEV